MNIQHKLLSQAIRTTLERSSHRLLPERTSARWQLLSATLWASVFALGLAGGNAFAQDDADDEDEIEITEAFTELATVSSEIEVGFGDVSDSSYRFGRYTGLQGDGLFPVVNLDIYHRGPWDGDDASYWRLTGRNLGIESRDLSFEMGRQGSYSFHIGFDEIPHYQLGDAQTIFNGAGSTNLTLPANWVGGQTTATMTQLLPSLHTFGIEHSRKRVDIGGDIDLPSGWYFKTDYRREVKEGTKTLGLTIGNSGGNPRSVVAPEPIDYVTQQIEAVVSFADATKQFSAGYYVSLFDNENDSLIWQNPYSTINGWAASAGFPTGQGQIGLAPDNQFHQLNLTGGFSFSKATRLTANVSVGRATQNEDFLPYTINPTLAASVTQPLPVNSLDGEVDLTYVTLRLTTHPWDDLSFAANYKFDDRDNKTHHHEYVYIGGDSTTQNTALTSGFRRFNEPKSYREHNFKLDATWRTTDWLRIAGEAQWKKIEREHQEREEIDEDRVALNFTVDPGEFLSGGLRLNSSNRDGGSEYLGYETFIGGYSPGYTNTVLPFVDGFPFENLPGLRKYNQADRERKNGELFASFVPGEEVAISASVNYSEDDYDNSDYGLQFSRVSSYNVDVTWAPTAELSAYAFASEERYKTDQDGKSFGGATRPTQIVDPGRDWHVKSRDDVFSYGFGFSTKFLEDALTVGIDYVSSESDTDVLTTTGIGLTRANLPTAVSDLVSASLFADYQWRKQIRFRMRVAYEDYESTDWSIDNVPANQLANVILLGESSPDYSVMVTTFTVGYRF